MRTHVSAFSQIPTSSFSIHSHSRWTFVWPCMTTVYMPCVPKWNAIFARATHNNLRRWSSCINTHSHVTHRGKLEASRCCQTVWQLAGYPYREVRLYRWQSLSRHPFRPQRTRWPTLVFKTSRTYCFLSDREVKIHTGNYSSVSTRRLTRLLASSVSARLMCIWCWLACLDVFQHWNTNTIFPVRLVLTGCCGCWYISKHRLVLAIHFCDAPFNFTLKSKKCKYNGVNSSVSILYTAIVKQAFL